ncbi:hypothetical protein DZF93_00720, partial [Clavibacter michiganensis subsp. insidiosus]
KAEQAAAREQERADRLAARYGRPEAEQQQEAAGVQAGAALGAAAASSTEAETDSAAITSDGRDAARTESAEIDAAGQSDADQYTGRELQEREMLQAAGIDPDERSTDTRADSSWTDQPAAPEISRGDDGMER